MNLCGLLEIVTLAGYAQFMDPDNPQWFRYLVANYPQIVSGL